ncbi:hypothetical protein [Reticulibacter mediterranei]|nr:hypothetical protein [Reticulibacter mediterranei]
MTATAPSSSTGPQAGGALTAERRPPCSSPNEAVPPLSLPYTT